MTKKGNTEMRNSALTLGTSLFVVPAGINDMFKQGQTHLYNNTGRGCTPADNSRQSEANYWQN